MGGQRPHGRELKLGADRDGERLRRREIPGFTRGRRVWSGRPRERATSVYCASAPGERRLAHWLVVLVGLAICWPGAFVAQAQAHSLTDEPATDASPATETTPDNEEVAAAPDPAPPTSEPLPPPEPAPTPPESEPLPPSDPAPLPPPESAPASPPGGEPTPEPAPEPAPESGPVAPQGPPTEPGSAPAPSEPEPAPPLNDENPPAEEAATPAADESVATGRFPGGAPPPRADHAGGAFGEFLALAARGAALDALGRVDASGVNRSLPATADAVDDGSGKQAPEGSIPHQLPGPDTRTVPSSPATGGAGSGGGAGASALDVWAALIGLVALTGAFLSAPQGRSAALRPCDLASFPKRPD